METFPSFAVDVDSGCALAPLTSETLFDHSPDMIVEPAPSERPTRLPVSTLVNIDATRLDEAGWAIMFGRSVSPAIKRSLAPLMKHREGAAGRLFRIFEDDLSVNEGEKAWQWLARLGVAGAGPVNPEQGVPYYILIVASPDEISFEFQYSLDFSWACGRLWFDPEIEPETPHPELFARYAASVVEQETAAVDRQRREIALFAPTHPGDRATTLLHAQVAVPLAHGTPTQRSLAEIYGCDTIDLLDDAATLGALLKLLGRVEGAPALLFSGSHGAFRQGASERLAEILGAPICADWKGSGPVGEDHMLTATAIGDDVDCRGLIYYQFSCYGAGTPARDDYDPLSDEPEILSSRPILSRLPQRLLSHPRGSALAFIGHVERVWSTNFLNTNGDPQPQSFFEILGSLLKGRPVGMATDGVNMIAGSISAELHEMADQWRRGVRIDKRLYTSLWVRRNSARNLIVMGDPATRLRLAPMGAENVRNTVLL